MHFPFLSAVTVPATCFKTTHAPTTHGHRFLAPLQIKHPPNFKLPHYTSIVNLPKKEAVVKSI